MKKISVYNNIKYILIVLIIPLCVLGQGSSSSNDKVKYVEYSKNSAKNIELKRLLTIGESANERNNMFYYISGLASDEYGNIYVTDKEKTIRKYNSAGQYIKSFGREGEGPGEFKAAIGLYIKKRYVYLYDNKLFRLTKYNLNGKYMGSYNIKYNVNDFAVKNNGDVVFLAENAPGNKLFVIYDRNGKYVGSFGKREPCDSQIEEHYINNGKIVLDMYDNLYFSRTQPYRIEKYDQSGKLLMIITKKVEFPIYKPRVTGTRKEGNLLVLTINGKSGNTPTIIERDININNDKIYNMAAKKINNLYDGIYVIDVFSLNGDYLYQIPLKKQAFFMSCYSNKLILAEQDFSGSIIPCISISEIK